MNGTTALLIIDVQRGYFDGKPGLHEPDRFLDVLTRLLDRARAAEIPVVYTRYAGEPGNVVEYGTEAFDVHDRVAPAPADYVLDKRSTDSFHETGLNELLTRLGVDHLCVTGCVSELCVDTTCRSALVQGYRTTLVADGHATVDAPLEGVPPRQRADLLNLVLSRVGTADRMISVRRAEEVTFTTVGSAGSLRESRSH
ncbi:cysteine hydrolase family protein [Amycolatopsis sp. cmx-4-54]|uniref:cysteine hydrolase family protein n=1 Tax=Amycolatopsis sp. cmx-4-54 TaxID=2790936 RepID=UPI00397B9463